MTMPSPRRVARRSVAVLVSLGAGRRDAANVIIAICDEAAAVIWRRDPDMDMAWLADISHEARLIAEASAATQSAVQTYSQRVATWARDFDRGHAPRIEQREQADRRPGA